MKNELVYWIGLAHLQKWGYAKINSLVVKFHHNEKKSIEEFFNLPEKYWNNYYQLDSQDILDLQKVKSELPNNAFLLENLLNEGFELIPIISPEYSKTLKQNLKSSHSPALLYVKGNKDLLQKKSVAIVGSRAAESKSLDFTDNIARVASKEFKVVVSGFAKGVDKQALDSALKHKGQSIIVLPQGISTFSSGFKTYYKHIVNGEVLVLSTFHPKAGWSGGLAMARNPIIYGLADEIYVAESSEKGGTWSGVIDGLKKGRKIFVRKPELNERNANNLLIQKGSIPVDFNGIVCSNGVYTEKEFIPPVLNEPSISFDNIKEGIIKLFNGKPLTVKDIIERSELNWTAKKMTDYLKKIDELQVVKKGRANQYTLKVNQSKQPTLF